MNLCFFKCRSAFWMIFSWHILSTVICILLLCCPSLVKSMNPDEASISQDADLAGQAGIDADNPVESLSNLTAEQNATEPVSCDVDFKTFCPDDYECSSLRAECIQCSFNHSCSYGTKAIAMCTPVSGVNCTGDQTFEREYECSYCYQLPHWQTWCNQTTGCALNRPRNYYPAKPFFMTTCWAQSKYLCLGRRCFHKQVPCNWSKGYKWSTTLLLSIFLGGFGVDRFYLGLWKAGLGKLLSFGGLGVWTLVDVILIAVGYVVPWDGSLYI